MNIELPEIEIDRISDTELAEKVVQLFSVVEAILQENKRLQEQVEQLRAEVARLKGRPRKPRFSDSDYSVSKKLTGKKREWDKSGKKDKIEIDKEVELPEVKECECGSCEFKVLRTIEKKVQGIIIRRNNILYRGKDKQCVACGKIHNAQIPKEIKGYEFDSELRSWISFFKYECRMTYPLIHDFLTGIGIRISTGQIANIIMENSNKLIPAWIHLKIWGIKTAKYLHSDATGVKRKLKESGKIINQHIHFVGHRFLSIFQVTRKYNSGVISKILGKRGVRKPYISDGASPNGERLDIEDKQLCWWHEIGLYLKLEPEIVRNKKILEEVLDQLWRFYEKAIQYGRDPTPALAKELADKFDSITGQTTGYRELDKRFRLTEKKKDRLLLFLAYPWLPITNNEAERGLRKAVIIRKISGETKSKQGDKALQRHLSVMHTARKQGLDVFATLHGLLIGDLSPFVLTAKKLA